MSCSRAWLGVRGRIGVRVRVRLRVDVLQPRLVRG